MQALTERLQKWYPWIVGILCFVCVFAYTLGQMDMDSSGVAQKCSVIVGVTACTVLTASLRILSSFTGMLAAAFGVAWFCYAFLGNKADHQENQVRFAYFFVLSSFAVLVIPPFVKTQAIGSEPIGIISGCVPYSEDANIRCEIDRPAISNTAINQPANANTSPGLAGAQPGPSGNTTGEVPTAGRGTPNVLGNAVPLLSTNTSSSDPARTTAPIQNTNTAGGTVPTKLTGSKPEDFPKYQNQWLVNIGGVLTGQNPECKGKPAEGKCKPGSQSNRAWITGGLVVPLSVLIVALFGGAISLSRRVPEIQKRVEASYVSMPDQLPLKPEEAREQLAFQILQFMAAPLIAIVAHHILDPKNYSTAIALAFMAGFGSETILLMIRGVATGLAPQRGTLQTSSGTVHGTVTDGLQIVPEAEIEIAVAGNNQRTTTDLNGRFHFNAVPVGPAKIVARLGKRFGEMNLQVLGGHTTNCTIALDEEPPALSKLPEQENQPGPAANAPARPTSAPLDNITTSVVIY